VPRWQDIPVDLPSGSTCWRRLQEWALGEVLEKIQAVLIDELAAAGKHEFAELPADATFNRAKKGMAMSGKTRLTKWLTTGVCWHGRGPLVRDGGAGHSLL
jgi:hypothetical protein